MKATRPTRVICLASLIVALAACGGPVTALTSTTTTSPKTSTTKATTATTATNATTTTVSLPQETFTLYFMRGTTLGVAQRTVGTVSDPHYASVANLLFGPSPSEAAAGLSTDIPQGTVLRGLEIRGGTATVNFSPNFVALGSSASLAGRLAQVVYTITSFSNVTAVIIKVGGTQIVNFAGVDLTKPVGRSQVTAALPGVLLEDPAVGSSIHGQLFVSGITSINGTYEIQLVDPSGKLLAAVTSTAVVNGNFQQAFPLHVTSPEIGTLRVFARPSSPLLPAQEYQFDLPITP